MTKLASVILTISVFLLQSANAESTWSSCINEAQQELAKGNFAAGETKFKQSLATADESNLYQIQWSHYYLGELYLSQKKLDLAEREFNAVLKQSRKDGMSGAALSSLAKIYDSKKNIAAANRIKTEANQGGDEVDYSQYMKKVSVEIKRHWHPQKLQSHANTVVAFYLDEEGTPKEIHLAHASGNLKSDEAALNAVESTAPFGKLPSSKGYPCIDFSFEYNVYGASGARYFAELNSPAQKQVDAKFAKLAIKERELKHQLLLLDNRNDVPPVAALKTLSQLMDCLIEEKNFGSAQKLATRILAYYEKGQTPDLTAAHVWLQKGGIAVAENKMIEARDCYKQSLLITRQVGPAGSAQEQESTLALAKCLYQLGEADAAKELYDKLKSFKATQPK
ncbi:MAG: TonB C-terminal domain-containing protein [Cyanobacteria bacterium SZAS-4]|nr:TonB C-terminal domain-containing protein [Cyanobacteria bacterium SZAS-4]